MKVKDFFTSNDKWTQGVLGRWADGLPLMAADIDFAREHKLQIGSLCLIGAIYYCYGQQDYGEIVQKVEDRVGEYIGLWNDNTQRRFTDIRKLVKELDI